MTINVIGIDPSMNNTGVAFIFENHEVPDGFTIVTRHIDKLQAGRYSKEIKGCLEVHPYITAGFIENFDDVGGGDTTKATIRSLSRAGGQAESELVIMGIPMVPLTIHEWRKAALGQAPKHPRKNGSMARYWTKGKGNIPSNMAPALLNLFRHSLKLETNCKPIELFHKKKDAPDTIHEWEFERCVEFVGNKIPKLSSTRIKHAFGKSLDELEAAAIALAGYRLIKSGQIEGL